MMRGQRDICLLRRHVFRSQHSIPSSTRYTSARSREPYILPRLVIDLDANDSQFVRQATEEDYAVPDKPARRQRHDPAGRDEIVEKEVEIQSGTPLAFNLRAATPPDLLQYALLGNPFRDPGPNNANLREVFKHHKVHALDPAESKAKRLTSTFTTDPSKLLESAGFTTENEPRILEQIRECKSFNELQRMVSIISSTTEGCQFLAANGADVVKGIVGCRQQLRLRDGPEKSGATATKVLKLLNNLSVNMHSKHVAIGPDLCSAALYYASQSFSLPCVRKYLRIMSNSSYGPKKRAVWAMSQLAIYNPHRLQYQARHMAVGSEEWKREVLKLMTGWESNGTPQNQEKKQSSFRSTVVVRSDEALKSRVHAMYVQCLGYLGASDAIWYQWQSGLRPRFQVSDFPLEAMEGGLPEFRLVQPLPVRELREKTEIYALSFLMASDPERALLVLAAFFELATLDGRSSQLAGAEETPTRMLCEHTRNQILSYYKYNKLAPTDRLVDQLQSKLTSEGPEAIFHRLKGFLVLEWTEPKSSTWIPFKERWIRCSVDWIKQDGIEGIAIKNADQKIMYFRPSSRRSSSLSTGVSSDSSRPSADE